MPGSFGMRGMVAVLVALALVTTPVTGWDEVPK